MAQGEAPQDSAPAEGQTPEPEEQAQTQEARPQEELPDLDKLLERYDPEALRKNRRLMGIAGELAKRLAPQEAERMASERAERIVRERLDLEEAERSRRAALAAARRGDYQALGERRAREVLEDDQKRYVDRFRERATTDAYGAVQSAVNEVANGVSPEVVAAAAEKMGELPSDADWAGGFKRWLPALIEAQAEHLANQPERQKKVEEKLTPALRSRLIAEMNGTEPVADSGGGKAPVQRQITDEQIAEMGPEEWLQVYDIKTGKFKPGVAYKPTRAIDPKAMQVVGRGQ
jgi:hypothetical protein